MKVNQTVTVEYQTRMDYCRCCDQALKEPKISQVKKFNFNKSSFTDWLEQENWKIESEDNDALTQMIEEFVYETISFFATSSDARLIIENSEFEKVKKFCLEHVC